MSAIAPRHEALLRIVERVLRAWVATYNEARPHEALGGMTQSEYRAARLGGGLAMAA